MPRCPKCHKHFPNTIGVTRHRAQPRAACNVNNDGWEREVPPLFALNQQVNVELDEEPVPPRELSPPFLPVLGSERDDFGFFNRHTQEPEPEPASDQDFQHQPGLDVRQSPVHPAPSDGGFDIDSMGRTVVTHPNGSSVFDLGETFLARFQLDPYSAHRRNNLYYPFASLNDWEMANFLITSRLSMRRIDNYLSLPMVARQMPLSFRTAKDLRSRVELLPSGPRWKFQVVPTTHTTKEPAHLYYRDSLECIELLFNHPFFADKMDFTPFRLFTTAERIVRVYTEWMSSDSAWEMQSQIPEGGTLCGVILSSDKTHITNISGGRSAHPLLISLANIKMNIRNKGSSHAFLLLALMPIVRFIHPKKRMLGVLDARLYHQCLDIIIDPLKKAAAIGAMMSDPLGNLRYCFTPLVSHIADTPEAAMGACVRGLTSHVTMASYKEFGDADRHEPRTAAVTISQLASIECDPLLVEEYFAACEPFRLNGVSHPYWRDWPLAEPAQFFTPETLHHWHGEFWDHDVQWCIRALGDTQIDHRFSLLPPITGLRRFSTGITKLKQVCGRVKRDVQRYLIVVIAGATNRSVVIAIRALLEFRYIISKLTLSLSRAPSSVLRNSPVHSGTDCDSLSESGN